MAQFKSGKHLDIPMEEYIQIDAIGRTDIQAFLRSPQHFLWGKNPSGGRGTRMPSEDMIVGSGVNDLFLQPEVFADKYIVLPEINKRTKVGKEAYDSFVQNYGKGGLLTEAMDSRIRETAAALEVIFEATRMKSGHKEVTLLWEEGGIPLRGRPDSIVVNEDGKSATIYDLKVTHDAGYSTFTKHMYTFGYYLQAGLYSRGLMALSKKIEHVDFKFICIEPFPPFAHQVFPVSFETMLMAKQVIDTVLQAMRACDEIKEWPGYSDQQNFASLPVWATRELVHQLQDIIFTTGIDA